MDYKTFKKFAKEVRKICVLYENCINCPICDRCNLQTMTEETFDYVNSRINHADDARVSDTPILSNELPVTQMSRKCNENEWG